MTVTRVLVVDDHAVVRRGIRQMLADEPDFDVVGEAADGGAALEAVLGSDVDLVIMDVSMPPLGGIDAARHITEQRPAVRVLMLSMHDNERYLFESLRAGASGYVLKSVADRDLLEACRAVMRGEPFVYPSAVKALIEAYLKQPADGADGVYGGLTDREQEIVRLIAEGRTTKEIAETLVISTKTVESHRGRILEKLGLRNPVEVARYAIRHGLIEP